VIIPSAFFSVAFSGPQLQIGIGVILIFALATSLIVVKSDRFLPRGRLGVLFGASSGFMSATAGIGGPAMGVYAILTGWDQKTFAATLQPYFVTLGVTSFLSKFAASGTLPNLSIWMWVGIAALLITTGFMLFIYRLAGIVAIIGLLINMAILFGAMSLFGFTLTMPGIAGLVLTIGMAVDANVLIYERLREEMEAGKTLAAALDAAYEKAFSAIADSNITTLISALILFVISGGLVKGFAITLMIGLISSMIGALIVTRVIFIPDASLHTPSHVSEIGKMYAPSPIKNSEYPATIAPTCPMKLCVTAFVSSLSTKCAQPGKSPGS
jgi:hypothetical protein